MKVIGYIRVSTADQAREGVSLEAQRDRIHKWALLNEGDVAAIHEDAGISGKSMDKRPGLVAALAATGKGDALVAYSISRFARSTRDMLTIASILEDKGANLVSLSESIDTTTAAGTLMFRMLAVFAEFERDVIGERTRMGLAMRKAQGVKLGCPTPHKGGEANRLRWLAIKKSREYK
jgi:site-specific DNA recombinase